MAKSAQSMADRFATGLAGAAKSYQEGVSAVKTAPSQKAIAAKDKWAANVQKAIANDSFAAGLQGVSLSDWQNAARAASSKLTGSAATAKEKFLKYASKAQPIIEGFQREIDAMPNLTEADAEARATRMIQLMRTLKGVTKR